MIHHKYRCTFTERPQPPSEPEDDSPEPELVKLFPTSPVESPTKGPKTFDEAVGKG